MATNTTNFNLSKPAYTDTADIAVINSNMDKVDTSLQGLGTGLAIISKANTHVAITSGQYVYVHGHSSLAEGLYKAKNNISANATLSTSNLQAVSDGGLNALNDKLTKVNKPMTSGYTLNDRGSYEEDGILHLKGSVSANLHAVNAGEYLTVAFVAKLPSNANGVMQPVAVGYGNKMLTSVAKVELINGSNALRVFVTDEIYALGSVNSVVYINMDYAC